MNVCPSLDTLCRVVLYRLSANHLVTALSHGHTSSVVLQKRVLAPQLILRNAPESSVPKAYELAVLIQASTHLKPPLLRCANRST